MADVKIFFGIVVMVVLAVLCVVGLYTFGVVNSGVPATTDFPLVNASVTYQQKMMNISAQLTNSTQQSLSQNPFINVAQNFVASAQTGLATFQIIYDTFSMFINIITVSFASAAFAWLPPWAVPLGIAFVAGGFAIVILGVALRWWT